MNKNLNLIRDMIRLIGDDSERRGVLETPQRVIKSWDTLYSGYKKDPVSVFKIFEEEEKFDELVLIENIEFFSVCEHHILPFFGKAHIAYIPDGPVIGASKLPRLLEIYCRRLQIQERIGKQVVRDIMKYLKPKGAACILEAQHLCMMARGIEKQNSVMVTSCLEGCFKDIPVRSELFNLIRRNK